MMGGYHVHFISTTSMNYGKWEGLQKIKQRQFALPDMLSGQIYTNSAVPDKALFHTRQHLLRNLRAEFVKFCILLSELLTPNLGACWNYRHPDGENNTF